MEYFTRDSLDGYEGLACAIIEQAIIDNKTAKNGKGADGKPSSVIEMETKRFFNSDWFKFLNPTELTGSEILNAISEA